MATWEENAASIIDKVESGEATASQQEWYNKWLASGQPSSKDGMMSWEDYNAITYGSGGDYNVQKPSSPTQTTDYSKLSNYLTPDGQLRSDLTGAQLYEIVTGGLGVTSNQLPWVSDLISQAEELWGSGGGKRATDEQLSDVDVRQRNLYESGGMTPAQMDQFYRTNGHRLGLEAPPGFVNDDGMEGVGGGVAQPTTPGGGWDTGGGGGGGGTGPGGGGTGPGGGTSPNIPWTPEMSDGASWNWDFFRPGNEDGWGWGGYDEEYGVFEKYQPGQESIWGNPDRLGGNQEFYQQQFGNLLRQNQAYQTRQRAAQLRAAEAAEADPISVDYNAMWESMGFEPNRAVTGTPGGGGGAPADGWSRNTRYNLTKGMTNQDAVNAMNAIWTPDEAAQWSRYFGEDGGKGDSLYWLSDKVQSDPNVILSGFENTSPEFLSTIQKFINNAWQAPGSGTGAVYEGGMSVPFGYAAPV